MITYSFEIKETDPVIIKRMQRDMVAPLNQIFSDAVEPIRKAVVRILEKSVRSQPEWFSVARGNMRMQFGLPNSLRNIQNILSIWLSTVDVRFKPFKVSGDKFSGGIKIQAVRAGYMDVLKDSAATFTTEKGDDLTWLKWLLTEGTNIIIKDYQLGKGQGRAGRYIMIHSHHGWGVPPAFAGVKDNNMITRAIQLAEPEIEQQIIRIMT